MKKTILIIVIALVLIAGAGLGWYFTTPAIKFTTENPTLELGDIFEPLSIVKSVKGNDYSKIEIDEPESIEAVGSYNYTYSINNKSYEIVLTVTDTTAPVITIKDNLSFTDRDEITVDMLAEAKDLSEVKLSLDLDGNDITIAGNYTVKITAEDSAGNKSEETANIEIIAYVDPHKELYYPSDADVCWNCESNGLPYLIAVNRSLCCVTVYTYDGEGYYTIPFKSMICSVGKDNEYNQTPLGRFTCGWKADWCEMMGNYVHYGRYATWINTNDVYYPDGSAVYGIMFHSNCYLSYGDISTLEYEEYNKLGTPASLGCVRLTVSDAKWIYDNCAEGTIVVVYEDSTSPGPLGKPTLKTIDTTDEEKRGWEPTDPSPDNPWNQ